LIYLDISSNSSPKITIDTLPNLHKLKINSLLAVSNIKKLVNLKHLEVRNEHNDINIPTCNITYLEIITREDPLPKVKIDLLP